MASSQSLPIESGDKCALKDAGASIGITVHGKGTMEALELHAPAIVRYDETTDDEVFISKTTAINGVEIINTGVNVLVGLRYFGPDTWGCLPEVGSYKN